MERNRFFTTIFFLHNCATRLKKEMHSFIVFIFLSFLISIFHELFVCVSQNSAPFFELTNLISGVGYNVFLIAQNAKGRSNSTVRQVFTLNNPEKQTDTSSLLASTPSLASLKILIPFLLFGCAGTLTGLTAIVVVVIRKRIKNRSSSSNSSNDVLGDQSTGGINDRTEAASYAVSTQRTLQSSQEVVRDSCGDSSESMEKNPDIIPQGNCVFSSQF